LQSVSVGLAGNAGVDRDQKAPEIKQVQSENGRLKTDSTSTTTMNIDDCSPYHTTLNRLVAGSIPAASTIYINHLQQESGDSQETESCLVTVLMAVVPIYCCSNLLLWGKFCHCAAHLHPIAERKAHMIHEEKPATPKSNDEEVSDEIVNDSLGEITPADSTGLDSKDEAHKREHPE